MPASPITDEERAALLRALPFQYVWFHDFEFHAVPGERPDVICLAAHELRSGRIICRDRKQLGPVPPYDVGPDSVFVNFVANAECACHLALGWPLPSATLALLKERRLA